METMKSIATDLAVNPQGALANLAIIAAVVFLVFKYLRPKIAEFIAGFQDEIKSYRKS